MASNVWKEKCPKLLSSQLRVFANITEKFTTRSNFGLFSFYTTKIGEDDFFATLGLQEYEIKTLAILGEFLILKADTPRSRERHLEQQ